MSITLETVDNALGLCQQGTNTETVAPDMAPKPCDSYQALGDTKPNRGGRPRLHPEDPWIAEGVSKATYYRRIKPVAPVQVSYAIEPRRWYCVRTEYGAESVVNDAIRADGHETLYPLLWVAPIAARRTAEGRAIPATTERTVPLLSRYVMVKFDRTGTDWRRICTMRGVDRIISSSPEWPTPIPESDIIALRHTLAPDGVLYPDLPINVAITKRKWTNMVEALKSLRDVAA